jgi:hypothetical protein
MISKQDNVLENLLTKFQKYTALALAAMLAIVVMLSTVHLGSLIAQEIWKPPRFLIPVQGLLTACQAQRSSESTR